MFVCKHKGELIVNLGIVGFPIVTELALKGGGPDDVWCCMCSNREDFEKYHLPDFDADMFDKFEVKIFNAFEWLESGSALGVS